MKNKEKVAIRKDYYPKHMHKLLNYYGCGEVNRVMVLDGCLKKGILSPLSEKQKKGVMTIVYSDMLPKA